MDNQVEGIAVNNFEALHALYDNKQQWVRHYESLLAQLTPLSTTASLVLCAYLASNYQAITYSSWFLAVPAMISIFAMWFNWWCDSEIKRQFKQIVCAEKGMGFYNIRVEDEPVLPLFYQQQPIKTRPIIWAGYASQAVGLTALMATFIVVTQ